MRRILLAICAALSRRWRRLLAPGLITVALAIGAALVPTHLTAVAPPPATPELPVPAHSAAHADEPHWMVVPCIYLGDAVALLRREGWGYHGLWASIPEDDPRCAVSAYPPGR